MKNWKSRLLWAAVMAMCMVVMVIPTAFAAEEPVAWIGDQAYDTLQEALNAVSSGQTIQLAAGNLGAGELGQTAQSEVAEGPSIPTYSRTLENVTIRGAEGEKKTVIDGLTLPTGHIYGTGKKNPVTGADIVDTTNSYYSVLNLKNITIENISFTKSVYLSAYTGDQYCTVDGFTLRNCSYTGTDKTVNSNENRLLSVGNTTNDLKNFVIENCTVDTAFQGVYVQAVNGIRVTKCSFNSLGHNAIAIQDGTLNQGGVNTICPSGGEIVLTDNIISNGDDRAIRFGHIAEGSAITITGNTFTDASDSDGELIKAESLAQNAVITVQNNTWTEEGVTKSEEELLDAISGIFLAEVNGTRYSSLSSALSAAQAEAQAGRTVEITLLDDVTGTEGQYIAIPQGMTVVLDLNGCQLIGVNSGPFIENHGRLTINDSSTAKTGAIYTTNTDAQGRHAVVNYGTLTINGGTFGDKNTNQTDANDVQRGNALRNLGSATIDGGFFTACDNYTGAGNGYAYAIANGDGTHTDAVLTINSATVYGKMNGVLASDGGTLTVNGGTYTLGSGEAGTSYRMVYTSGSGSVVINGGTFIRNVNNSNAFFGNDGTGKIEISNGTFENGVDNQGITIDLGANGPVEITGGNFKDALSASAGTQVAVSGGRFSAAIPEELCADGFVSVDNGNGTFSVAKEDAYVAQIDEEKYLTLQAAVSALNENETLTLLDNVNNADKSNVLTITLPAGATLDGDDKTLSGNICVRADQGGTIRDVIFEDIHNAANNLSAVYASGLAGKLTITGCTFDNCDWDAIQITPQADAEITIQNNTFRTDNTDGIYQVRYVHIQSGLNVDFSARVTQNVMYDEIKGVNGAGANCGALEIYYFSDPKKVDVSHNYIQYPQLNCILSGSGTNVGEMAYPMYTDPGLTQPTDTPAAAIKTAYEGTYYMTLQEAVEAVSNGGTVTLLADNNESFTITKTITFTVDKDTYSLTGEIQPGANTTMTTEVNGSKTTYTFVYTAPVVTNPTYTITNPTVEGGTVTVSPRSASRGRLVTLTVTPDEGYELASLTVTDSRGSTVTLTDAGNGKYTFTMPGSRVVVNAAFQLESLPFTDVAEGTWYYDAIAYVYRNGLMEGVTADRFAPDYTLDRATLATILWRLAGEPAVDYVMPFADVPAGEWYTEAIRWAASTGIVNGTTPITFRPMQAVTREQMAAMVHRYADYMGYDTTASSDMTGFTDAESVNDYAVTPMSWSVAEGLISGIGTEIRPQSSATRAQIATMLMRLCESVAE